MERTGMLKVLSAIMMVLVLIMSLPTYALASLTNTEDGTSTQDEAQSAYETEVLMELEEQREKNVKNFLLTDGTVKAVTYKQPVHYQNSEGKWIDIDNTLTLNGSEYVSQNKQEIKFANKSGSNGLVSIKDGGYKIDFTMLNTNKSSVVIENPQKPNSRKFDDLKVLSGIVSRAKYANIQNGIDLEYVLIGNSIKENIIINEAKEEYSFSFELKLNKLEAELVSNYIILKDADTGETKYEIPAPYMYDRNGEYSTDVEYTLTKESKWKYTLTVTASADWINSEGRSFPVTVDPIVRTESSVTTAYCSPDGYTGNSFVFVGDFMGYTDLVGYIKFNTLPTIPTGAVLTDADLVLYNYSSADYTNKSFYIGLFNATENWINNATYATRNNYMNTSAPLNYIKINGGGAYAWDITSLYQTWENGGTNNGICLKCLDFSGNTNYKDCLAIFTIDDVNNYPNPYIELTYTSPQYLKGLESYFTYFESSAGMAGTGYINAFNGSLTFVHNLFTTADEILPYSLSLIYNSMDKTWKFSTGESLTDYNFYGIEYFKWVDADGTVHWFSPVIKRNTFGNPVMYQYNASGVLVETDTPTEYYDQDGLGLKITLSSTEGMVLSDDKGNKKIFVDGRLSEIIDTYGNKRSFSYSGGMLSEVSLTPKNKSQISQLVLTHSENITMVMNNQAGIDAAISHVGSQINSITYSYGSGNTYTVNYTYDTNGYLISATDVSLGARITYNYVNGKARGIREETLLVSPEYLPYGNQVIMNYQDCKTVLRTAGNDNIMNGYDDMYTTYNFDTRGKVVSAYTHDTYGKVYGISSYELNDMYSDSSISIKTNNSIKSVTSTSTLGVNLLKNSGFSTMDNWVVSDAGCYVRYVTSVKGLNNGNALMMESLSANSAQSVKQSVYLSGGDYTLSYSMFKEYKQSSVTRIVVYASNGAIVKSSVPITYNENGAMSTEWERDYITFNVSEGTYTVSFEFTPSTSSGEFVLYDNVMLEKGTVNNYYSAYDNGEFNSALVASNAVNASIVNGKLALTPTILGEASYKFVLPAENIIDNQKLHISAYGKAINGLSNTNDGTTPSRFGILLKGVYSGSTVLEQFIPFRVGNYDNQYVSDFVNFSAKYINSLSQQETLQRVEIYLVYDHNLGTAYFDNVTLSYGSSYTSYEYNNMGYVSKTTDGNGNETNYNYADNQVDLISTTDQYGREYSNTYDSSHNITGSGYESSDGSSSADSGYTRNVYGQITQTTVGFGGTTKTMITQTMYNTNTSSSAFSKPTMTIDENGAVTRYFYNNKGMLSGICDNADKGIIYEYNAYGELLCGKLAVYDAEADTMVEATSGKQVGYEYSSNHTLSSILTDSTEYNFIYNEYNAIDKILIGEQELVDYDYIVNNGNLIKMTYGNGTYVEYTYDILDRIVGVCYNGVEKASYVYASNGSVSSVTDLENDTEYRYYYDNSGKLINERIVKDEETQFYRTYLYDDYGRPYKKITHYVFAEDSTLTNKIESYSYNANGDISLIDRSAGGDIYYSYDAFGRLQGSTVNNIKNGSTYSVTTTYAYADSTNRAYTRLSSVTVNGETTSYEYDSVGNITKITYSDGKIVTYVYDESYQLIRENNQKLGYTYTYSYDNSGNILQKKKYSYLPTGAIVSGTPIETLNYGYNNENWGDLLTSIGNYTITYDSIGNPLTYMGMSLSWSDGRLL
ncbi:MAG: RHS repeat protein, partial [Clostridia bacterium]|nr:RHS repeat protein [Clostridia bacterium]